MKICVTGHRPDRLYGYDINHPEYRQLFRMFKDILIKNNCTEAITGMALGADTLFALAIIDLKKEIDIKLHCAIPCLNHSKNWAKSDQIIYNCILKQADIIKLISNQEYQSYLMQKRNEYMVDNSDKVIAVWDGIKKGGTYNCIKYAKKKGKEIIYITPTEVKNEKNNIS